MRACTRCKSPTTFKATLPLKNGYALVMRWVLKICPDQMKRNKATHEVMHHAFCARCTSSTAFKATLSLKTRYAPVVRQVLKICLDHMENSEERKKECEQLYKSKKKTKENTKQRKNDESMMTATSFFISILDMRRPMRRMYIYKYEKMKPTYAPT